MTASPSNGAPVTASQPQRPTATQPGSERPSMDRPAPERVGPTLASINLPDPNKPAPRPGSGMLTLAIVLAVLVLAGGIALAALKISWALLAAGCVCVVAVLTVWTLLESLAATRDIQANRLSGALELLSGRVQEIALQMSRVAEQQLLSDRAKAVAFRDKDRDALRRAIHEDLSRKDWEAALVLANEMERVFGYKGEADRVREEIFNHQQELARKRIAEVVAVIDVHCRAERWNEAIREGDRLQREFPDHEQVAKLPQEIETRRQMHKKQLLDAWHDAIARKDIDGSIEILKRLDLYLTRSEAESMEETARGIFREKLNNLRTQFALAVQDRKWADAVRVGEQITRDFPNSGIASEVREKMDTLRQRAAEPATAGV